MQTLGKRALPSRSTALGRALHEWRQALVSDLGGEAVSTQQRALVELATRTKLLLDSVDAYLLGVEESNGGFKMPSDRIPPGTAINATSRSKVAVRYYEPLLPAVAPFLADPPIIAPLEQVPGLHGRLTLGGVGAAISHNLLE